jgi:hypothetical protein
MCGAIGYIRRVETATLVKKRRETAGGIPAWNLFRLRREGRGVCRSRRRPGRRSRYFAGGLFFDFAVVAIVKKTPKVPGFRVRSLRSIEQALR